MKLPTFYRQVTLAELKEVHDHVSSKEKHYREKSIAHDKMQLWGEAKGYWKEEVANWENKVRYMKNVIERVENGEAFYVKDNFEFDLEEE